MKPEQVLPASTGVIGVELDPQPDHQRAAASSSTDLDRNRFDDVARAILTTDTVTKTAHARSAAEARHGAHRRHDQRLRHDPAQHGDHARLRDDRRRHPAGDAARRCWRAAVERSYNRISVDGDTSTNDTVLLLANGASGVQPSRQELSKVEDALSAK